jgi:hypothetical protein
MASIEKRFFTFVALNYSGTSGDELALIRLIGEFDSRCRYQIRLNAIWDYMEKAMETLLSRFKSCDVKCLK